MDLWILRKLQETIQNTNNFLEDRDFSGSAHAIYSFIWNDFCDTYLELSKFFLKSEDKEVVQTTVDVLFTCIHSFVCLAHPFMPFLTEELWHYLQLHSSNNMESVMLAPFPQHVEFNWTSDQINETAENILSIINSIRSSRKSFNLQKKDLAIATIYTNSESLIQTVKSLESAILGITVLKELAIQPLQEQQTGADDPSNQSKRFINADLVVSVVPVKDNIVDVEEERNQMLRERESLMKSIAKLETQMNGKGYAKARQEIRDEHSKSKESMEQKLKQIEIQLQLSTKQ